MQRILLKMAAFYTMDKHRLSYHHVVLNYQAVQKSPFAPKDYKWYSTVHEQVYILLNDMHEPLVSSSQAHVSCKRATHERTYSHALVNHVRTNSEVHWKDIEAFCPTCPR